MYKRVLLKLSGEALSNSKDDPFSTSKIDSVATEVKEIVNHKVEVGIVIGGGNIYRGKMGEALGMDRTKGDYMGMLATIMNALAFSNALDKLKVKNVILTAMEMSGIGEPFNQRKALEYLENGYVLLFAGGTGHPYFSTDTCSSLRALQTKCDIILVAKNGVDGVYSADPKKDKKAVKFDNISYQEIIEKDLQVMDLTAITMCRENNLPLFVFNMNEPGNITKAALSKVAGTIVK